MSAVDSIREAFHVQSGSSVESVSVFVYPGQEAYATHRICDADFFYNYFRTWIWESGIGSMPTAPYTSTKLGPGVTECHTQSVRSGSTVTNEPFCKHQDPVAEVSRAQRFLRRARARPPVRPTTGGGRCWGSSRMRTSLNPIQGGGDGRSDHQR